MWYCMVLYCIELLLEVYGPFGTQLVRDISEIFDIMLLWSNAISALELKWLIYFSQYLFKQVNKLPRACVQI